MAVKLILKEDIEALGEAGDVVNVKPGYARNYLLPERLAMLATAENLHALKDHLQQLKNDATAKRQEAEAQKNKVEAMAQLSMTAKVGPTGKLFGRITAQDIAEILSHKIQLDVDRKQIQILGHPRGIDELGSYEVVIAFCVGVSAKLTLLISEEN